MKAEHIERKAIGGKVMSASNDPCFYEEIGVSLDGKVYETGCGDEFTGDSLPATCGHCGKSIEVAPGCRRCGSTEHTTGYHDESNASTSHALPIAVTSVADLMARLRGGKS